MDFVKSETKMIAEHNYTIMEFLENSESSNDIEFQFLQNAVDYDYFSRF